MNCRSLALFVALLVRAPLSWSQACNVSTVALQFGDYDLLSPSPDDAHGSVTVTCAAGTAYVVKLDAGIGGALDFSSRRMLGDTLGQALDYNIFTDAARTRIWGDGTGISSTQEGLGAGTAQAHHAFGRLPPRQNVGAGRYSDSIAVTVEW